MRKAVIGLCLALLWFVVGGIILGDGEYGLEDEGLPLAAPEERTAMALETRAPATVAQEVTVESGTEVSTGGQEPTASPEETAEAVAENQVTKNLKDQAAEAVPEPQTTVNNEATTGATEVPTTTAPATLSEADIKAAEAAAEKAAEEAAAKKAAAEAELARKAAEAEAAKKAEAARKAAEAEAARKAAEAEAAKKAEEEKRNAALVEKAMMVMSWQMDNGGWWKNNTAIYERFWDGKEPRSVNGSDEVGTIDNYATVNEIKFLIDVYNKTKEPALLEGIYKGYDYLLEMQYDSGAFPQYYPYEIFDNAYVRYGTFNDEATVRVLRLMRDTVYKSSGYEFVSDVYKDRLSDALDKGVDFILKSQIVSNGVLSGWCAQHDPYTYKPRPGRSYELVSISGFVTADLVDFLGTLGTKDERIVRARDAAIAWLDLVGQRNTGYKRYGTTNGQYFVHSDSKVLWYRFYEIDTNRPFFANRNGEKVYSILDVDEERRHGYAWAGCVAMHLVSR